MGIALVAVLLTVTIVVRPSLGEASAGGRVLEARIGDVVRFPGSATRCEMGAEGGAPRLVCHHAGTHRYEVSFFGKNILVFRVGNPDKPVFSARGRP
jgi:hypothetical protein